MCIVYFDKYKEWASAQKCCDCGELASNKTKPWVTETQCLDCWLENGSPEKRGLPSAEDLARSSGVYE